MTKTQQAASGLSIFCLLLARPLGAAPAETPHGKTPGRMSVSVSASGQRLVVHYGGHRKTYKMVRSISEPVLSPDGRQAAYILMKPPPHETTDVMDDSPNSLWILETATGRKTQVAASDDASSNKDVVGGLSHPIFSNDGTQIYFQSSGIATDDTLQAIDLVSRRIRYICGGGPFRVIRSGPYRDDLVIYEQEHNPDGSLESPRNWLVLPEGRRIKPWGSAKDGPEPQ